jgi:hypothetical protein
MSSDHDKLIEEIIDALEGLVWTFVKVKKTDLNCLFKNIETNPEYIDKSFLHSACGKRLQFRQIYTQEKYPQIIDVQFHLYNMEVRRAEGDLMPDTEICPECLELIKKNPKRYGHIFSYESCKIAPKRRLVGNMVYNYDSQIEQSLIDRGYL